MKKRLRRAGLGLLLATALLWIPDCEPDITPAEGEPFVWNQDAIWNRLEARFVQSRERGCHALSIAVPERLAALEAILESMAERASLAPNDPAFGPLEDTFFATAADVAACPQHASRLVEIQSRLREVVKDASTAWDLSDREARSRLYRILYGSRMAIEEVLLQMPAADAPTLSHGRDEPSESPSTEIHGVRVHSGDVLVSRGGAPTSAFIARGNDFPGNFSHIALVHVDDEGTFRTIESHIEVGVVVAGLERYENDRKLRVMLLRPRADLKEGPFGHLAANYALEDAQTRHIAYDFAMNYEDPDSQFCSEVASSAYRSQQIALWDGLTSMSSEATASWLAAFGVRSFVTHGPSDLEYDPKLVVVAEWRNRDALFEDHVDAAVIDAMLEGAEAGDRVQHERAMLPIARVLKAWSWLKNRFGAEGPIPEGMSATVALRVSWMRERHGAIEARVLENAEAFEEENGYRPPYWELVRMANEAREATP